MGHEMVGATNGKEVPCDWTDAVPIGMMGCLPLVNERSSGI
jgi:hypothetical protein